MKLPRVRFTVRRLMVAMAVIAVLAGGVTQVLRWRRISRDHAQKAAQMQIATRACSTNAEIAGNAAEAMRKEASGFPAYANSLMLGVPQMERKKEVWQRKKDRYARLMEKYRQAARYPWLPVEPDPPEPE